MTTVGKQLLDSHLVRNLLERLLGIANREWNQNAARPRRNLVDVEPEPFREQHDLRWNRRHGVVIVLSQEAEINLGKGVNRGHAAESENAFPRAYQNGIIGPVSGELEPEIGLYRGADIRGAAVIDGPAAVLVLMAENLPRRLLKALFIARSQQRMQENVIGFEGGVGFEFAAPEAFRLLAGKKKSARAIHCGSYAAGDVVDFSKDHLHWATGGFVHSLPIPRRRKSGRAQPESQPRSPAAVRNGRFPP